MLALVHFVDEAIDCLADIRRRYDPRHLIIAPHITLIFPLPPSVVESELVPHVDAVLRHWPPFGLRLRRLTCSDDAHLFLVPDVGGEELVRLHDELYTGFLRAHLRTDLPFIPHVTLGVFRDAPSACAEALTVVKAEGVDIRCEIRKLHVVDVRDEKTPVVRRHEFTLKR
jgi:2'-5' RNA ligase